MFSFWVSAFAGFLLYYSLVGGEGPARAVRPTSDGSHRPSPNWCSRRGTTDYWTLAVLLSGIGHRYRLKRHHNNVLHALQGNDVDAHALVFVAVYHNVHVFPAAGDQL